MLSRHPTVIDGRLQPRHIDLRPFAICSPQGRARAAGRSHPRRLRARGARGQLLPERWQQGHVGAVMSRPLIGVTVSEIRSQRGRPEGPTRRAHPDGDDARALHYMRAVERAGGLPVALPPLTIENVDSAARPSLRPAAHRRARPGSILLWRRGAPRARAHRSGDRRVRDRAVQACRRRGTPHPRHLPGRAGAERGPAGHPASAPSRLQRWACRASSGRAGSSHHPRGARGPRQRPRPDHRWRPGEGQLLSPPGDRPPGRSTCARSHGRRTA